MWSVRHCSMDPTTWWTSRMDTGRSEAAQKESWRQVRWNQEALEHWEATSFLHLAIYNCKKVQYDHEIKAHGLLILCWDHASFCLFVIFSTCLKSYPKNCFVLVVPTFFRQLPSVGYKSGKINIVHRLVCFICLITCGSPSNMSLAPICRLLSPCLNCLVFAAGWHG